MANDMKKFNHVQEQIVVVEVIQEWSKYAKCLLSNGNVKNIKALEPDSFDNLTDKKIKIVYFSGRLWNEKTKRFDEISECIFLSDMGQDEYTTADGLPMEIPIVQPIVYEDEKPKKPKKP